MRGVKRHHDSQRRNRPHGAQTGVVAPTGQTQLRHRELAPRGTGVAADRTCTYRSIAATGRGGAPRGPAAGWVRLTPRSKRLAALRARSGALTGWLSLAPVVVSEMCGVDVTTPKVHLVFLL